MANKQGFNNALPPLVNNLNEILQQLTILAEPNRNHNVSQVFHNSNLAVNHNNRANTFPPVRTNREIDKQKPTRRKPRTRKNKNKDESYEAGTSWRSVSSNSSVSASPLKNKSVGQSKKDVHKPSTSQIIPCVIPIASGSESSKPLSVTFSIEPARVVKFTKFIRKRSIVQFINLRSFESKTSRCIFETKLPHMPVTRKVDNEEYQDKAQSRKYPKTESRRNRKKKELQREGTEFVKYLTEEEVEQGLSDGTLKKGTVRINMKNYREAYVNHEDPKLQDYILMSVTDRNRALEGDEVILQIKPKEEWTGENETARVVYIKEKNHPRQITGSLKPQTDHALFVPRDRRFPVMRISQLHWPNGFREHPKEFDQILFIGKLLEWDVPAYGTGIILEKLGKVGNLPVENLSIIRECNLDISPFSSELKEYLPEFKTIPEKEFEYREDLRKKCIFTIDPATARDLDDAVSVEELPNGNYEIGVHISDASFFLTEGTELDQVVSKKATTIYMVDNVYHMLPLEMCMGCSLLPGQDKLSFSVFWEMTPRAEVLSKRFTRSIMNSCAKLAYEHAQMVIDNPEKEFTDSDFPEIHNGFEPKDAVRTIKILQSIATILRENRFKNGALRIDNLKLMFDLNPATGEPLDFSIYKNQESHRLIEEFMLLANISVAEKIYEEFPEIAFLRCHEPPKEHMLNNVKEKLAVYGIHVNTSTAGEIQASLNKYRTDDNAGYARDIALNHLMAKTMTRARYFCSSLTKAQEEFKHYALSVPIYTHFTSPIRRYADIMVHRLLAASLEYRRGPEWDIEYVEAITKNCNTQKYQAKKAQDASMDLYLAHFIETQKNYKQDCVVVDVREKKFDVVVLKTGSVVRIHPNNCGTGTLWQYEPNKLTITFPKKKNEKGRTSITVELLSLVKVVLKRKNDDSYLLEGRLVRPETPTDFVAPKKKRVRVYSGKRRNENS